MSTDSRRIAVDQTSWETMWTIINSGETVHVDCRVGKQYIVFRAWRLDLDFARVGVFTHGGSEAEMIFEAELRLKDYLISLQKELSPDVTVEKITELIEQGLKPSRALLVSQGNGFTFVFGSKDVISSLLQYSVYEREDCTAFAVQWAGLNSMNDSFEVLLDRWATFQDHLSSLVGYDPEYSFENDGCRIRNIFFKALEISTEEDPYFYCLAESPTATKSARLTLPGGPRFFGESSVECAVRKLFDETGHTITGGAIPVYHDSKALTHVIYADFPKSTSSIAKLESKHISQTGECIPAFIPQPKTIASKRGQRNAPPPPCFKATNALSLTAAVENELFAAVKVALADLKEYRKKGPRVMPRRAVPKPKPVAVAYYDVDVSDLAKAFAIDP